MRAAGAAVVMRAAVAAEWGRDVHVAALELPFEACAVMARAGCDVWQTCLELRALLSASTNMLPPACRVVSGFHVGYLSY